MNGLPLHLLDEILFRLDLKSLAMMGCTNRFIKSHISDNASFEIRYSLQARSCFIYARSDADNYVFCQPLVSSCVTKSPVKCLIHGWREIYILGSCSGHLLIYKRGLYVVNPLTKKFRLVEHSGSKLLATMIIGEKELNTERAISLGFAVDRSGTTKRFKIVCILEINTMYVFEISEGDSCRFSETTITTNSRSELTKRMKPVYLEGTLHWLRNDGSIIAFNPETEQARFIPSIFQTEPDTKLFFAPDNKNNRLTLISGTKEAISFYTLIEEDSTKWALARQIKNILVTESEVEYWNVVAYDGKHMVVKDKEKAGSNGVAHVYNMEDNSWGDLWSTGCEAKYDLDFYNFTPFFSFFEQTNMVVDPEDEKSICRIMRFIDKCIQGLYKDSECRILCT